MCLRWDLKPTGCCPSSPFCAVPRSRILELFISIALIGRLFSRRMFSDAQRRRLAGRRLARIRPTSSRRLVKYRTDNCHRASLPAHETETSLTFLHEHSRCTLLSLESLHATLETRRDGFACTTSATSSFWIVNRASTMPPIRIFWQRAHCIYIFLYHDC